MNESNERGGTVTIGLLPELDEVEGLNVQRPGTLTQALAVLSANQEMAGRAMRDDFGLEEVLGELNLSDEHKDLLRTRNLDLIQAEAQREAVTGGVIIAWALVRIDG